MNVHPDFADFVLSLSKNKVDFVIVGAFALSRLGHPRATGDLDLWIRPEEGNIRRLFSAISDFGLPAHGIRLEDMMAGKIVELGQPPVRIDLLTRLTGLTTEEVEASSDVGRFGEAEVRYLGREAFIRNKKATGRHKDLADLEALGIRTDEKH